MTHVITCRQVYGAGQSYVYRHEQDESTFKLVDTSRPQRPMYRRRPVQGVSLLVILSCDIACLVVEISPWSRSQGYEEGWSSTISKEDTVSWPSLPTTDQLLVTAGLSFCNCPYGKYFTSLHHWRPLVSYCSFFDCWSIELFHQYMHLFLAFLIPRLFCLLHFSQYC